VYKNSIKVFIIQFINFFFILVLAKMACDYSCELDPATKTTLQVYLIRNVKNVEEIRKNIISGDWKCAIIKPSLILDPLQIVVAANKAVVSEKCNSMVTRTVYAEILYNLSLTKNITQSLSKFGIEKETDILVCFLKTPHMDCSEQVLSKIKGDTGPISDLKDLTDLTKIKNVYKLNDVQNNIDLLGLVISRMVTKSFVSY
jgi:EKC/KEOPS complex subunit CGI121/TPRKB